MGGEDSDTIRTGAADDVVIGDNANLMVEHNNPIGVFAPSNEITLDEHTIDTSAKEDYLGYDNVTLETVQHKYDPQWELHNGTNNQNNGYWGWGSNGWGWYSFYNNVTARGTIDGIKEPEDSENTGRKDDIVDEDGMNLLIEGQRDTGKLYDPESLQPVEDPNVNTDDPNNENQPNGDDEQNDGVRTIETPIDLAEATLEQGEKVKVVFRQYPKSDNYTPNLHLQFYSDGGSFADLVIELYSNGQLFHYDVKCGSWTRIDIADHVDGDPNLGGDNCVIYVSSNSATSFKVHIVQ